MTNLTLAGMDATEQSQPSIPSALAEQFFLLHTTANGLTDAEAQRRLQTSGPNDPISTRSTAAEQILRFFLNPLVIILLLASLVSAIAGDRLNAFIIFVLVLLSVVLNFWQTFRSQKAADKLRENVAPMASALRDGKWVMLPRRNLVPGDIIRLAAGNMVPADARLITARDLHVQEAALTGESMPVDKEGADSLTSNRGKDKNIDTVFLGTSVVSGTALAVVFATGRATAFGDIAARLATRPPETEFERGTRQFGLLIMKTVFFLVMFVLLINIILKHNPLDSLLFAIALAVGLTPEFLPMITSVTLAASAVSMAHRKVIVKHLESMQNFGSMEILCSDKTGTLTGGDMELDQRCDAFGKANDQVLLLAYLNSAYETGIQSPLDKAILRQPSPNLEGYVKRDEIPFDFERRRLSVIVEKSGKSLLIAKGAPEGILPLCISSEIAGQSLPFDEEARKKSETTYRELSAQGYRVLAVAFCSVESKAAYHPEDERGMTLAGFLSFLDPPLTDAGEALRSLKEDGVELKILTGDNELVTRHICEQVGLDASRIVLGDALDSISDPALGAVAEQTTIFARVSPSQKNRIILALRRRGHVVGYLGDGINDAPSLHAADVGISVSTAVDVAKDAASIILMERSLKVLHEGILQGRKAFGNVMKYLLMGTSSNFGNMFSMAGASLLLPFLPMLPTQILLNNFLYDLAQVTIPTDNVDESYLKKPQRWNIKVIRNFMMFVGPISSVFDFLTFFVLLKVFHASEPLFHTGWFVESLATQTLVLFIIRTTGNPLCSRPSLPLTLTTLFIVLLGIMLPFTPLAHDLGFTPLPGLFFVFLFIMTIAYLGFVELVKRRLMK